MVPGEFDNHPGDPLAVQPYGKTAPRDKLEQYRDAALDFYQGGKLDGADMGYGGPDMTSGSLAKILSEAPEPLTPREPIETITRDEFEELAGKLRNVDKVASKKDRSWCHRCQLSLRWYHVVLAVILNDVLLIALGASVGSAFYSIEPIVDGSFRAAKIEVEGLQIDPDQGRVKVMLESKDKDAELALVSFAGEPAMVTMTDATAPPAEVFTMLSVLDDRCALPNLTR